MKILGIETSCDDTAAALIEAKRGSFRIIRELRSSQIDLHKKYGGVVPEVAARAHAELIMPLIRDVIARKPAPDIDPGKQSRRDCGACPERKRRISAPRNDIKPDVIAVTAGPGLITALMVGVQTAASLAYAWDVPLVAVNHIEGHIYGNWLSHSCHPEGAKRLKDPVALQDPDGMLHFVQHDISPFQHDISPFQHDISPFQHDISFPALALIVSGGHTELILMSDHGKYKLIGKTRDDAAGECFDKVGKLLGFDYPGGPKISEAAETGDPNTIPFPRPMINSGDYDFSFAGLKTAALYWLRNNAVILSPAKNPVRMNVTRRDPSVASLLQDDDWRRHFSASFEQAIVDVLVAKTICAAKEYRPKSVLLGGGVAANRHLRAALADAVSTNYPEASLTVPPLFATVDNAPMIAVAGYFHALRKDFTPWKKITANPNWRIA